MGNTQHFQAKHLHVQAFAAEAASLSGQEPLTHYPRLAQESVQLQDDTAVYWNAQGRTVPVMGGAAEIWMDLEAHATVWMQCQRCLEPSLQELHVQRSFRFVQNESAAEKLDDEIEEDVLVYGKDFDLYALIEDELLMELPVAPRHGVCPQMPVMQVQTADYTEAEEEKPNPFAVLQGLKQQK